MVEGSEEGIVFIKFVVLPQSSPNPKTLFPLWSRLLTVPGRTKQEDK